MDDKRKRHSNEERGVRTKNSLLFAHKSKMTNRFLSMSLFAVASTIGTIVMAQVDPDAPCPDAKPNDASCCYDDLSVPVLGGIDFVDLASKDPGKDGPAMGSSTFSATLNNYTFFFLSEENKKTFVSNPWNYAPSWGGF